MPFAHRAARLLFAPCLLALAACAHRNPSSPSAWAGDYAFGQSRLQLHASGEFEYEGASCFPEDTDVGLADEFAGRYRIEDRWLILELRDDAFRASCSSLGLKLYTVRADGHAYLFDDTYLRALVNEVRAGKAHVGFPTWHRVAEPETLPLPLGQWLPSPYADWLRQPPPSGQVIAIGAVETRTRYGSAGRIDGVESSTVLHLDIGRDDGAFVGMRVCVDGHPGTPVLDDVGDDQSTLHWRWSAPNGTPPRVGTRVSGQCPTSP